MLPLIELCPLDSVSQYMVIDLNLFTPGQPLPDGTLYVGEQVPGYYVYEDFTEVLSR